MTDSWTPLLLTVVVVLFLLSFRKRQSNMRKYKLPAIQSVPSQTRNKGESPIYRNPSIAHDKPLLSTHPKYPNMHTVHDAFQNGLQVSKNEPCMGVRINDGPYVWETYSEVAERIKNFGSGLLECGLESRKEHFVGMMAKNCPEWVVTMMACAGYGLVVVPLYDTLGPDAIKFIINQTKLSVVVVEGSKLENILSAAPECPSLKYVVKIGSLTQDDKKLAKDAKISLLYFKGVEALGKDSPKPYSPSACDDLFTVCYTSGTTDAFGVLNILPDDGITSKDVHLSFLPLAHIFEMLICCALMGLGARVAFYRGDILKLLDDVAEAKPTIFPAVPRLLNRIYSKIMQTVNESSPLRRFIFNYALNAKKSLVKKGVVTKDSFWDKLVFKKIQARLGGRVKFILTGAAPISADALEFFRCSFGCEVLEGYGQTESSAGICVTRFGDYSTDHGGHVGGVLACNEIKLVDIPEMNYFSTDPNPRGEIWVRGNNIFKGYYKLPDITAETLTKDGWCKTGDVGMMLPGGTLKIIDRKKHIFKLSQGEYIAPEKIENIYVKSQFVAQVFVYGESVKSVLVGIVVVDPEQVTKYCKDDQKPMETTDSWLNAQKQLKQKIMDGLIANGKLHKLHSFEQVKEIYLTFEQWTTENGLLTPSMKPKRHEIKNKYKSIIDKMYLAFD